MYKCNRQAVVASFLCVLLHKVTSAAPHCALLSAGLFYDPNERNSLASGITENFPSVVSSNYCCTRALNLLSVDGSIEANSSLILTIL